MDGLFQRPVRPACWSLPNHPATLEPLDAQADADFDTDAWRLTGVLGGASAAEGSCGGAGPEDVLEFTAPAAGFWSFSRDPDASEVPFAVYLRRECDLDESEVSCSRLLDFTGLHDSAAQVDLEEGESIFVFVDADDVGAQGDYAVLATRTEGEEPPRLTSAEAFRRPNGVVVTRVTGEDENGDAHLLVYVLESADGEVVFPVPRLADGVPFFPETPLAGRRTFEFTLPDVAKVPCDRLALFLVDSTWLESQVVDVVIQDAETRAHGEDCDVTGLTDVCDAGSTCSPSGRGGMCLPVDGPQIEHAVFQLSAGGYIYADVDVSVPQGRVLDIVVSLLPADRDTPLAFGPNGEMSVTFQSGYEYYAPGWSRGVQALFLGENYVQLGPFSEARRVRVEVSEAGGPRLDTVTVPLLPGPLVGEGLPCDVAEFLPVSCDEGLTCVRELGAPNYFDGLCAEASPPIIDEAIINVDRLDQFRITVRGRTQGAPLEWIEAHLLTEDSDEPLIVRPAGRGGDDSTNVGRRLAPIVGPEFEVTYSPVLEYLGPNLRLADVPEARRLVLRPWNDQVGPGDAVVVPIGRTVQAAAGEPCDVQGIVSECGALGACVAAPGAALGVCETRTPPHLTQARAAYNPESRRLGVTLEGVDPDGDAEGRVKIVPFVGDPDSGGEALAVIFTGPEVYLEFESFVAAGETFEGSTHLPPYRLNTWQVATVTHVQVSVLDGFGLESEVVTAEATPAEVVAVGAACDPLYAFQRCEGGGLCPTDAPTCGRNVCGDGLPGLDEACDDGNLNPGDGCSPACELERLPRPFEVNGPSEFIEVADDATDWVALQVPRAGYLRISYGFDNPACMRVDEPLLFLRARQPDDTWFTVWPPFPDQQLPQNGCINGFEVNVPAGVYRLLIDSPASGASGMLSAQVSDF